jgi:methionyl-tRNA formyltransferase
LSASPVALAGEAQAIPLYKPQSFSDPESLRILTALAPELIVVAAYGLLLPPAVLRLPVAGCVNVHASLLPRWRGAAPVERAILAGDTMTGVSIMRMEEGLDTGPYCAQAGCAIGERDAATLMRDLAQAGADLLDGQLPLLLDATALWTQQDEHQASYADKLHKAELRLEADADRATLVRRVRASGPSTPARCRIAAQELTILRACSGPGTETNRSDTTPSTPSPGAVCAGKDTVFLACADGWMELLELKPAGRRAMSAADWLRGIPPSRREGLRWD